MGEWERKSKAKAHEQCLDRATVMGSSLGTNVDEVYVQCTKTSPETEVPYGALLRLIDRKQLRVFVYLNARKVAEVCDEDSRTLRDRFAIASRPGRSIEASNVSAIMDLEFTARLNL